ncbi:MAG: hypothetical protein GY788_11890 [bacterium]|nr:hypothetical protein [bacterium]
MVSMKCSAFVGSLTTSASMDASILRPDTVLEEVGIDSLVVTDAFLAYEAQ